MTRIWRALRDRLRHALGGDDPPGRVAAAWATGLAIALSPLLGLHTALALLIGLVFRLNKPDIVAATTVINPWTMPVYYPAALVLGSWLTGIHVPLASLPEPLELLDPYFWQRDRELLWSVFTAWAVGSALCSLAVGIASYHGLRRLIVAHRRRVAEKAAAAARAA